MSPSTIAETCECGATFKTSAEWASDAREAVAIWRTTHRHADSVGICGDRPPALRIGDTDLERPHCQLKAGHAGMHSDGEGHWSHPEPPCVVCRESSSDGPVGSDGKHWCGECYREAASEA